jgi:hypothetical protein
MFGFSEFDGRFNVLGLFDRLGEWGSGVVFGGLHDAVADGVVDEGVVGDDSAVFGWAFFLCFVFIEVFFFLFLIEELLYFMVFEVFDEVEPGVGEVDIFE